MLTGWLLLLLVASVNPPQDWKLDPESPVSVSSEAATNILSFSEIFESVPGKIQPSRRILSLVGKRVTITGFMAHLELAPLGSFYLCPRPVSCDEAGGGTADIPIENVRVIAPTLSGKEIRFLPGRLEVTGVLEVGNSSDPGEGIPQVRIILDSGATATPGRKHQ